MSNTNESGETVPPMEIQEGMHFSLSVMDGTVLMVVTGLRCGDVWDCYPHSGPDVARSYSQEYGAHEVFTTEQLRERIERFRKYRPSPDWSVQAGIDWNNEFGKPCEG